MSINRRKSLMYLEDRLRQVKIYLKHPGTDLKYILGVFGLLCILGWFLIKGDWLTAVLLLGLVILMALSFTIFGNLGVMIVNAFRKEQFDRQRARKTAIMTITLVTLLVVSNAPLDLALGIIAVMALRAVLIIVSALLIRE